MTRLSQVRWGDAVAAFEQDLRANPSAAARARLAEIASLSALYERDYVVGRRALLRARELEPLNPVHELRRALHDLAFGRWEASAATLTALASSIDAPIVPYLRALSLLLSGDMEQTKKAMNIAREIGDKFPAARLLHVDARARTQFKGTDALLRELGPQSTQRLAWADLVVKVAALHPVEAPQMLEKLPAFGNDRAADLARAALQWVATPIEKLGPLLSAMKPESARERLALAVAAHTLERRPRGEALRLLAGLHREQPARTAVRRWYAAAVARHAVEEATHKRFGEALRAVELCIRLEPHESIHHQNRAALMTLVGDRERYLDAWADFERLQVRLALLGRIDSSAAQTLRRTHRMFARQARLPRRRGGAAFGIFIEQPQSADATGPPPLRVNQERIDADPEQLRQWIHHRTAELVYSHLALGPRPERFLLHPTTPTVAQERLEALARGTRALSVLVPLEGELLADRLVRAWRESAALVAPRYGAPEADPEVTALEIAHHETIADLALLAFQFEPRARRRDVVEELVEMGLTLAPFFHEGVLYARVDDPKTPDSTPLRYLVARVSDLAGGDDPRPALSPAQRRRVVPTLCAQLLVSLALELGHEASSSGELDKALGVIDRARQLDGESAWLEFHAAQLLAAGTFYDDARAVLQRVHRLARRNDERVLEAAERLEHTLARKRSEGAAGEQRHADGNTAGESAHVAGERDLEAAIARCPSAVQNYEQLSRTLLSAGRSQDAIGWGEQAMRRCLTRAGQTRARRAHLEALGAAAVAEQLGGALRLYLAGAPQPLADALDEDRDAADRPYAVHYLHGAALLDVGRPKDAAAAFARAGAGCSRQAHQVVLRILAADAEALWFEGVKARVERALEDGDFNVAVSLLADAFTTCDRKERCLATAARVSYELSLAREPGTAAFPALDAGDLPWAPRLAAALGHAHGRGRARTLAELGKELWPASADECTAVLRRIDEVAARARLAGAIDDASAALQGGDAASALAALDAEAASGAGDAQWVRLRIVALLRLDRFDEADASCRELEASADAAAQELVERYPALALRFRIDAAARALGSGAIDAAIAALEGARAADPQQALDLAYTRAFVLARMAERARGGGDSAGQRDALERALDLLEPHRPLARTIGKTDALDLYDHIDDQLARIPGGSA